MKRILLLVPFIVANAAVAQLPQIRITGVFPPGAQVGSSVDVTISAGSDLDEATELIFSHPGLTAAPKKDGNGQPIANQFSVKVADNTRPGLYDVRLRGLFGVSNPRVFRIDSVPEVQEKEPNNTDDQAQEITSGSVVNARANGGADVDVFKIAVTANQPLVIRSEAAAIDSVMQPVLELFDANGRRVAHSRRRRQKDASIVFTSPTAQTLLLKVHDTVYAGSNDYGYRLSIGSRPQIDFVSPQVLQAGVATKISVYGRHVPEGQKTEQTLEGVAIHKKEITLQLDDNSRAAGTDSYAISADTVLMDIDGNLIPFAIQKTGTSQTNETEGPEPITISVPANIAGSFASEMDEDRYRVDAKKGDRLQIDVLAHRLGSNADPMLIVEQITTAADGTESAKRIGREDIGKINPGGANLPTLTSDPAFTLTAPADGTFQIRLKDRFAASRGAPNLTYSLLVQPPAPDFRVVVFESLPSADGKAPPGTGAVSLRKGGTYQVPVYVYRTGGHNSDVSLTVEGPPKGITSGPVRIPAGKSSATLVFNCSADVGEVTAPVRIIGQSAVGETQEKRTAKITTLVHGGLNGLPRTARVSETMLVSVMKDEQPFQVLSEVTSAEMTQDQQLLIPLKLTRRAGFDNKVDVSFVGQPGNVDVPKIAIEKGKDSAIARFYFKENAPVGQATMLMYATGQVAYRRNPWLVDKAQAKVDAAVKELEATKKSLEAAKAASAAGAKKVADLEQMVKTYEQQLKVELAAQKTASEALKKAVAEKATATQKLLSLKEQLAGQSGNGEADTENFDAALKAVQDASTAVVEATKPVTALTQKLATLTTNVAAKQKLVADKTKQVNDARAAVTSQQKIVEKAKADMTTAEASLKAKDAEKKAADAAVKKAQDATKPKNINYRTVALPVSLTVHPTPGKLAAAVPDGGAIKKGAKVDVKVTLTRKNKFAGAVKVALALPNDVTAVASNSAEIPADKTEATLTLTAAADAAVGTVANAVIRATVTDFNGRKAEFDAPVTLKITE